MARQPVRTDAVVKQITTLYDKGKSIREIARKTGFSYGFVHSTLATAPGVTLRRRGASSKAVKA